ncbi:AP2-associated kinase [Sporothrix schenckii 1099-18]|uniref:non-specific serine/threonine protein kinase n=1 Tax=Sporothrix schenckii 1099-18 TaxID=1397361 RepID=A0A0F2M0N0_SPOSC|nr:AP2-associated kinase [Sporothrix schenckii 1099-18]KJR83257.1 AP2-associated kinase [Sporothrix schenckii 1099-18]
MASHSQAMPASRPGQHRSQPPPPQYHSQPQQQVPAAPHGTAPQGTFAPGTKIQVGSHRVVIQKYLSEGGFAHVYLVKLQSPIDGTDLAVLKRVAVPDKDALRSMRTEVETMKRLKGHRAIVTYFDSHASELRGGGYEVFLLMEYCDGGGLMDFMNTRLQHRLTEPEILSIFSDVAEGVACMHYLKPPLLHRDLKVENVLISKGGSGKSGGSSARRRFKLCDFGSAAPPKAAPVSVVECRLMDEDVQRHTTLQYRSPEMIDVYRRQPIDEKSDIWALGVLLYKLCYYTTPFEDQSSQLAILNASYRFPSHPTFSDRLKALIGSMLREDQGVRPNIYQVLKESCAMQGKDTPVKDIYSGRSQSEPRGGDRASAADKNSVSAPVVGAVFAPTSKPQQAIPDIVPMRRGRPTAAPAGQPATSSAQKPSASPMRVTKGDPFAALDSKSTSQSADELSNRFPTLDQFSILHDQGTRFSFDDQQAAAGGSSVAASTEADKTKDLKQRVTERLAGDAFVSAPQPTANTKSTPQAAAAAATAAVAAGKVSPSMAGITKTVSDPVRPTNRLPGHIDASSESSAKPTAQVPQRASEMSRASAIISSTPELQAISAQREQKPKMVSTGTMTSPSPTPPPPDLPNRMPQYQVFRFPPTDHQNPNRASSLPRKPYQDLSGGGPGEHSQTPPPHLRTQAQAMHIRHPSSSRPSLEGQRPNTDSLEPVTTSVPSLPSRPRPTSTYLESNMDYLREREVSGGNAGHSDFRAPSVSPRPGLDHNKNNGGSSNWDETPIESNVDYLRSMEEQPDNKRDRGLAKMSGGKRSSMTALAGTKNLFAGKFGDAFKRFETSTGGSSGSGSRDNRDNNSAVLGPSRTPSPLKQLERNDSSYGGTGSGERYRGDPYDNNELPLEVTDDMPPEVRREIERRRLSMEEKRVAAAAAEYRQRLARVDTGSTSLSRTTTSSSGAPAPMPLPKSMPKSIGGVSRAVSIQNRVQNLLSEARSSAPATRTASGYGHFTDDGSNASGGGAGVGRSDSVARSAPVANARGSFDERPEVHRKPVLVGRNSMTISDDHHGGPPPPKPSAKPKPMHLNKPLPLIGKNSNSNAQPGSPNAAYPASQPVNARSAATLPSKTGASGSQSALMAPDLPGQPVLEGMSVQDRDDYIRDFTRRFPSLTSIEMVERDLSAEDAHRQ